MAGTLKVDAINASTGVLATQNGMNGIAKAWVNFAGASGTINGGFNVSSVTRTGTGLYTVNFSTAQPTANYVVTMMGYDLGGTTGNVCWIRSGTMATGSFSVTCLTYNSVNYVDPAQVQFAVFGS